MTFPGIEDLMRQAQEFSRRMVQLKEDLAKRTVEGSAGGGMVRATCDGTSRIVSVTIEPAVLKDGDVEMLQDLVCAAVNQALEAAKQMAAEATRALTGGVAVPGLENLFGG